MSQVLHRKLRCLLDCTLPAGGSATEHMSARIGVLACFSPGSGPRSARMRGLQDRPRGGVRKWRERKAESGSGPQGWVRETGKSAGEHGPLGPLPSVKVRRSVRVNDTGNRVGYAGCSRGVCVAPVVFRGLVAGRGLGGKGIVAMAAVVLVMRFVREGLYQREPASAGLCKGDRCVPNQALAGQVSGTDEP